MPSRKGRSAQGLRRAPNGRTRPVLRRPRRPRGPGMLPGRQNRASPAGIDGSGQQKSPGSAPARTPTPSPVAATWMKGYSEPGAHLKSTVRAKGSISIRPLPRAHRRPPRCLHGHPAKEEGIGPLEVPDRMAMQVFVGEARSMVATPVQSDLDGIPNPWRLNTRRVFGLARPRRAFSFTAGLIPQARIRLLIWNS